MNEVELHWYNTLSQQRTPEGYRHCTDCDSQRPVRFFNGKGRKCVDCRKTKCTTCNLGSEPRNMVYGQCPQCVSEKKQFKNGLGRSTVKVVKRPNNRVEDGKKRCTYCEYIKDVDQFYCDRRGNPKSRCVPCYNGVRSGLLPKRPSFQLDTFVGRGFVPNQDTLTDLRRSLSLLTRGETRLIKHRAAVASPFDLRLSRRQRYLRFAPKESYEPLEIFERDGWVCQLCNESIPRETDDNRLKAAVDHIVPVVSRDFWKHGDTRANVQATHTRCNSIKGNRV